MGDTGKVESTMKLLYGTGNQAKLEAMRRKLAGLGLEIIGLQDMEGEIPRVPEDGSTPLEKARQKEMLMFQQLSGIHKVLGRRENYRRRSCQR